jgi:hypothetical protein
MPHSVITSRKIYQVDPLKRISNPGQRHGRRSDDQQPDPFVNHFHRAISTYGPSSPSSEKETKQLIEDKELIPAFAYYQKYLGFDQETYNFYKEMLGRSVEFTSAFLDAESTRPDGYQPFFT